MKKTSDFVLVLQNIRSAHNVGSIFRTADGAGISKLYLTGYTPSPDVDKFGRLGKPQKEIAKTALGAEKILEYEIAAEFSLLIKKLKSEGYYILALEQHENSIKILSNSLDTDTLRKILRENKKIALCLGEEVSGFSAGELALADAMIEIPMHGQKESLNVSVAAGIAMYHLKYLQNSGQ